MPEPIIRPLLENAVAAGATDIHLVPGMPIMYRPRANCSQRTTRC